VKIASDIDGNFRTIELILVYLKSPLRVGSFPMEAPTIKTFVF